MADYNAVVTLFPQLDLDISQKDGRLNCYDVWFHHVLRMEQYYEQERSCSRACLCCRGDSEDRYKKRLFLLNTKSSTWLMLKEVFLAEKANDEDSNVQMKKLLKKTTYEELLERIDMYLRTLQRKSQQESKFDVPLKNGFYPHVVN